MVRRAEQPLGGSELSAAVRGGSCRKVSLATEGLGDLEEDRGHPESSW